MDFLKLFADQARQGFPDLAGSAGEGSIVVSERLLNAILAEPLRGSAAIREMHVTPRAGNRFAVRLALAKPSFLPALNIDVTIEKQPSLPEDPVLALTLSGMGGLLRFAGPAASLLKSLPPGVRMDGDRVFVDVRAALAPHGLTMVLDYVEAVGVTTEEGRMIVAFRVRLRG